MKNGLLASGLLMACVGVVSAQPPQPEQQPPQESAEKMSGLADLRHDFGTVPRGALLRHDFVMTNIYNVPVKITAIRLSSCTSALFNRATATTNKHILQPNEKATISVKVDTIPVTGQKSGSIYVSIGANHFSEFRLTVSAFVREDIVCNPGEVAFGSVTRGQTPSATVDVEYAGELAWQVSEAVVPKEAPFDATVKELYRRPGRVGYQVKMSLKKDAAPGPFQENIFLKTNDPKADLLPVLVSGYIQAPAPSDEDEHLEGKWSKDPNAVKEEFVAIAFERKDGRIVQSNINVTLGQGPRAVFVGAIKVKARGQKGVIELGSYAGFADLPEELAYAIDGDAMVLTVGAGPLKGDHKLRKVK